MVAEANTRDRFDEKSVVYDFWNRESCGEVYGYGDTEAERFENHARRRYELEPYIKDFARFADGADRSVLEVGVGYGADHVEWAKSKPADLQGIDLTNRAISNTQRRLATYGLNSNLQVSDAEALPFEDGRFDIVYSWGVIHCSPDTQKAVNEIYRVLKPGGEARIMIYQTWSFVGYMLWLRYALLAGRPWRSLSEIYQTYLESPGTKAYTRKEAEQMFAAFDGVETDIILCHGDLLESEAGQQHKGLALSVAKAIWPRWLIRKLFPKHGLFLTIEGRKPKQAG